MNQRMNEFDLIHTYFSPLSNNEPGAFNLKDDAAVLTIPKGHSLVCTKDALSEKTHFFSHDHPADIAKKLLGVNLSDLAAMGATPLAYLLALHLPHSTTSQWLEEFTGGFQEYTKCYGGTLIGGDTTSHAGPLCLSLTALGTVPYGKSLLRSGAQKGDAIYVSGTIGDSYAGLCYLKHHPDLPTLSSTHMDYLTRRYYNPTPRLALGTQLLDIASSCIDISDGLLADLTHVCTHSKTTAQIDISAIPLSDASCASHIPINELITGGDDYELLFTVPQEREYLLTSLPIHITKIGYMSDGSEKPICLLDAHGKEIPLPSKMGYKHIFK
jgi:thiamine-monophosphate kinase